MYIVIHSQKLYLINIQYLGSSEHNSEELCDAIHSRDRFVWQCLTLLEDSRLS